MEGLSCVIQIRSQFTVDEGRTAKAASHGRLELEGFAAGDRQCRRGPDRQHGVIAPLTS